MNNHFSEIKITVVIPVYNAGRYISRCLESLQAQTLRDLEFLFINDCTPDDSMKPVVEWADRDPRVRIIHNEQNLGEGGSRNRGLEAARGLYLNTMDPDDWIAPDFFELLYTKAAETSADVVKGTRISIDEETGEEIKIRKKLNKYIEAGLNRGEPLYLNLDYEHQTILFRRTLLDPSVRYGKSANAADTTFLLRLCGKNPTYAEESRACYYYLKRKGAATSEYSLRRSMNELISFQEQVNYFLDQGPMDQYAYRYCVRNYRAYTDRFLHAREEGKVSPREQAEYISRLKEILLPVPEHSLLYEECFYIASMIDSDILVSPRLSRDPSVCKVEVSDWMNYMSALHGTQKKVAADHFEKMLNSYAAQKRKAGASHEMLVKELLRIGSGISGIRQKKLFYTSVMKLTLKYASFSKNPILRRLLRPWKKRV